MKSKIPKWLLLLCVVFVVMQYFICLNVFLMGDDFMYGSFGKNGIFSSVFSYYFTGNGRWLINILDSLFLLFDRYMYMVLCPWLLLLLGFLVSCFVGKITNKNRYVIFASSLILLSTISVHLTCEIFYWITGLTNYVIPAIFLFSSMIAVLNLRSDELSKKQRIFNSFICVISCLTMEQYGLMSIGWMVLIWGWDMISTKKINKYNVLVFLSSSVALGTIIFAPATFVRLSYAAEAGNSFFTKLIDLFYYDYYSDVSATVLFILSAYFTYVFAKERKEITAITSLINALILLLVFDYHLFNIEGKFLFLLAIISVVLFLISVVPFIFSLFKNISFIYLISLFVIGAGSQIMLLKSDLWGFRTSFSWILLYLVILLTVIAVKATKKDLLILASISCIAVNPYAGLGASACLLFLLLKKKVSLKYAVIMSIFAIIIGLYDEVIGYKNNSYIHRQNIAAAESASDGEMITINQYIDDSYGWSSPPLSKFHEQYFRYYYSIPENVSIEYAENE